MDAIANTLNNEDEGGTGHGDDHPAADLKLAKFKASNAYRLGRHVTKVVKQDWDAWWRLSYYQRDLWKKFNNGILLQERNEAVQAFGHGCVLNEQDETIADLTMERCFAYRTMDDLSGRVW